MDVKKNKKYSDKERWMCIYPAYVNSKKTISEGRKIPKTKACEDPNYQEIRDVLAAAGFTVGVENKVYSREKSHEPTIRGRIRVHFKNDDGTPLNPKFPNRDSILLYCGEMIPKLKTRVDKANKPHGSAENPGGSGGGGKKKGKKR
ncbi:Signal recognition particle 19 kDa protein [Orchesella cincta]|uniref:Signal recognition particle 19 kDa protein n=1 Tax=Orchesella cincta TaxID=48709 RepID=A0A1D2N6T6_ORCCI|nr:Signal recognition particle 19 kDa protein [Orchesella cincta]